MPRKKTKIRSSKERAILSDVLPFELPATLTNRHFYDFLVENKIEIKDNEISWLHKSSALDNIIHLMFDLSYDIKRLFPKKRYFGQNNEEFNVYKLDLRHNKFTTRISKVMPFDYKINHKEKEFRELSIPHPRSQIHLIDFYNTSKETIIYYCSKSNFSIRKPIKIAKCKFHKDKTHYLNLSKKETQIEIHGKEYESLKSFFVYKKYTNIYKFYESYQYQRCEKKYNRLLKLDISKCFASIYTHSLSWATIGKEYAKKNLDPNPNTFGDRFDRLIRSVNGSETNGIIIGPEFSRIFAEILLQAVDKELEIELYEKHKLSNKINYEIFRYVDDYFIFYNEEEDRKNITETLHHKLKNYKLSLNSEKEDVYDKPLITEISIAKQKISNLLKEKIVYHTSEQEKEAAGIAKKGTIYIKSNKLISQFKAIIKESDVSYKDILNYSLVTVENKSKEILKTYSVLDDSYRLEEGIAGSIISTLRNGEIFEQHSRKNSTTELHREIIEAIKPILRDEEILKGYPEIIIDRNLEKKVIDAITSILEDRKIIEKKPKATVNYKFRTKIIEAISLTLKDENTLMKDSKEIINYRLQEGIIKAILAILEFTFFIYSVSPNVNTTIRLCRIIQIFHCFLNEKNFNSDYKHLVYKYIYDNILFILKKNKINEYTQVETLYLLIALNELGKKYWLEENILASYFNIYEKEEKEYDDKENKPKKYESKSKLNYLSYTVLLFYMKNRERYNDLHSYIVDEIQKYFTENKATIRTTAESIMLLFDCLSCPYIDEDVKKYILSQCGIENTEQGGIKNTEQEDIINFGNKPKKPHFWFTTWTGFNFTKELDAKQSYEVY